MSQSNAIKFLFSGSREATPEMLEYTKRCVLRCIELGHWIIVGDAEGVDQAVRETAYREGYNDFTIYYPVNKPLRTGALYRSYAIAAGRGYPARTLHMAGLADQGMHIWNGSSNGTMISFNEMTRLRKRSWLWLNGEIVQSFEKTFLTGR
jgi:hypothetical protein